MTSSSPSADSSGTPRPSGLGARLRALALAARLRALVPSLVLAAVSLLLAVAGAELVVRLVRPQPLTDATPGLYAPDPPRRYQLTPGHEGRVSNLVEFDTPVSIDARGMRTAAPPARSTGDERFDVLVLGDSFTFGWGVEAQETFVARLGDELAGRVATPVVTHNGGVPGFGLPDAVDWFEAHGLSLEPEAVVVAVFLGNDLLDATAKHREVDLVGGLVSQDGGGGGPRRWVNRHLHLVRLAKRALPPSLLGALRGLVGIDEEPWEIAYLRDTIGTYAVEPPPLVLEGQQATRHAFDRLVELSRRERFELALVLLPDARQVDPARWASALRLLGADDAAYDPYRPVEFFLELGRTAHDEVPVLDLLPSFRDAHEIGTALYFRYDPHWTVDGHALAADALGDFLQGQWTFDLEERNDVPTDDERPQGERPQGERPQGEQRTSPS
ncbi:MAG: SGNH/GDSL hydrolase family protein [Acidobacteriota bacterium]